MLAVTEILSLPPATASAEKISLFFFIIPFTIQSLKMKYFWSFWRCEARLALIMMLEWNLDGWWLNRYLYWPYRVCQCMKYDRHCVFSMILCEVILLKLQMISTIQHSVKSSEYCYMYFFSFRGGHFENFMLFG